MEHNDQMNAAKVKPPQIDNYHFKLILWLFVYSIKQSSRVTKSNIQKQVEPYYNHHIKQFSRVIRSNIQKQVEQIYPPCKLKKMGSNLMIWSFLRIRIPKCSIKQVLMSMSKENIKKMFACELKYEEIQIKVCGPNIRHSKVDQNCSV